MGKIFLEGSSQDEFMAKLCQKFTEMLTEKFMKSETDTEDLLSRKEAAKLLDVSVVTLSNWTNSGHIRSHRLGRRVYYKKSELMASLISLS